MRAELDAGGMQEAMQGIHEFLYALQKFRRDCENFTTIVKISQSLRNFAMHCFSL